MTDYKRAEDFLESLDGQAPQSGDIVRLAQEFGQIWHEKTRALAQTYTACMEILRLPVVYRGPDPSDVQVRVSEAHAAMREKACRWLEASVPAIVRDLDGVPQEVL